MATISKGASKPRAILKALIDRHDMIRDYDIKQHIVMNIDGLPLVKTVITIEAIVSDSILPEENAYYPAHEEES